MASITLNSPVGGEIYHFDDLIVHDKVAKQVHHKAYIDRGNFTNEIGYNPSSKFNLYIPIPSVPIPKESDYTRGYYYRYFYRISNNKDAPVYEVALKEYNTAGNLNIYKTLQIKWKLIGPKDVATEINTKIIDTSNNVLPGIKSLLINPLQFWKNLPDTAPKFDVTYKLPKVQVKKKRFNLALASSVEFTETGLIFILTENYDIIFLEDGYTGLLFEQ